MRHPHSPLYVFAVSLAAMLLAASCVHAGQVFLPGMDPGWDVVEKEGTARVYRPVDGDMQCICLVSESASFSIQREVDVDVKKTPYVSWRWKALELPKGGDFRKGSKDDQAAQFFVAFEGDQSISYIWDTTAPAGSTGGHWIPWVMDIKILVVKSGPAGLGEWATITRNVYEDYRTLFGGEPPRVKGLRFQINSQHTRTTAESCIDRVEFRETP